MDIRERHLPYWALLAWWFGGALLVWLASNLHYAINGAACFGIGFGCAMPPEFLAVGIFVSSVPILLVLAVVIGLWTRRLHQAGQTSSGPLRLALLVPPSLLAAFGLGIWVY